MRNALALLRLAMLFGVLFGMLFGVLFGVPIVRTTVAEDAVPGGGAKPVGSPPSTLLELKQSIALAGVEGRIDHLALDEAEKTLVVAALENGSLEVIDLEKGVVRQRKTGLASPQGVAYVAGTITVACGADSTVRTFHPTTLEPGAPVALDGDADNIRVDGATGRAYVGYGDGGLAVLEGAALKGKIPLAGHPEAFALETKGPRVFANVPDAHHVAVVDRAQGKVTETWDLRPVEDNYPMALDEPRHRLLVGCRSPAKLLVLDTEHAGKVVASLEISGDVDDVCLDAATRRAYLACGAGFIDVVEAGDADAYRRVARIPTGAGARTAVLSKDGRRLFLAVPHRGEQRAEVRVYAAKP